MAGIIYSNKKHFKEEILKLLVEAVSVLTMMIDNLTDTLIKVKMAATNHLSKTALWSARVMSGLVILFMLLDSIFKFIQPEEVVTGTLELGFSEHHIIVIGILGFISVLLYAYPRTSILGAILLTGYWGGAIATHFRLDNPLVSHILFPVFLAILAWGGVWLRDERIRQLVPLFKKRKP